MENNSKKTHKDIQITTIIHFTIAIATRQPPKNTHKIAKTGTSTINQYCENQ